MPPVLPALIAALSAAVWGSGDFCGGKASQKADPLAVTVLSQMLGLPLLALGLVLIPGAFHADQFARGAVAGIAGFGGIVLLYRGLSQGAMAIFSPVSAVTSAIVPMVTGLVRDGLPSVLPLIGASCAVVAIGLVSMGGGATRATPKLVGMALASGTLFGIFFVVLGQSRPADGMWPLLGVRTGSVALGIVTVVATRTSLRLPPSRTGLSTLAGVFDISANALFVVAAARGSLSIVAPISSLYPVSTVLLALGIDRERVRLLQLAGLGLAATALVLVTT